MLILILEAYGCKKIGKEYYFLGDSSVKCSENQYYTNYFILPLLVLWVVVLPGILFISIKPF